MSKNQVVLGNAGGGIMRSVCFSNISTQLKPCRDCAEFIFDLEA